MMKPQELYDWRTTQPGEEKDEHPGVTVEHMTQKEAGKFFGVSTRTILNWEMGHHPIPKSVEMVIKNDKN